VGLVRGLWFRRLVRVLGRRRLTLAWPDLSATQTPKSPIPVPPIPDLAGRRVGNHRFPIRPESGIGVPPGAAAAGRGFGGLVPPWLSGCQCGPSDAGSWGQVGLAPRQGPGGRQLLVDCGPGPPTERRRPPPGPAARRREPGMFEQPPRAAGPLRLPVPLRLAAPQAGAGKWRAPLVVGISDLPRGRDSEQPQAPELEGPACWPVGCPTGTCVHGYQSQSPRRSRTLPVDRRALPGCERT
jgi:hypothetical protein